MNVLIGKFGRSIYFDKERWSAVGGDNEPGIFFITLAKTYPEHTFIMCSPTDVNTYKGWLPSNILFLYNMQRDKRKYIANANDADNSTIYKCILDGLNELDITPHCGIFMSGPVGNTNLPKVTNLLKETADKKEFASCLAMNAFYTAPIVHVLNETKIPWVTIDLDPRYVASRAKDLINSPRISLSQINNKEISRERSKVLGNQRIRETDRYEQKYSGTETIFLIGKEKPDFMKLIKEKTTQTLIVCNEGLNGAPSRGPELLKYIGDMGVDIYGKWSDEYLKDQRFKGSLKFESLQEKLKHVKYTLCIPILKHWSTAKFWEMAYYGIIPFLHPNYDTQKNIKCPEYIRLKHPDEFKTKILELENDKKLYLTVLADLYKCIMDDALYDGSKLINTVMESATHYVTDDNIPTFKIKKEKLGLEEFM